MRLHIYILIVAMIFMAGCKKKSEPYQPNGSMPVSLKRIPVYQAEVYAEIRGPSGQSSVTAWLIYSHKSESETQNNVGYSESTKQWKTEECSISFSLKGGRECKISPIFLEHKDNSDIWQLDMLYTVTENQAGAEISRTSKMSKTVAFDGINPSMVIEDDHHSIIVRPREANTEHEDPNRPADAVD